MEPDCPWSLCGCAMYAAAVLQGASSWSWYVYSMEVAPGDCCVLGWEVPENWWLCRVLSFSGLCLAAAPHSCWHRPLVESLNLVPREIEAKGSGDHAKGICRACSCAVGKPGLCTKGVMFTWHGINNILPFVSPSPSETRCAALFVKVYNRMSFCLSTSARGALGGVSSPEHLRISFLIQPVPGWKPALICLFINSLSSEEVNLKIFM